MSLRRGIPTDQLTNVLQVIQLGRRTGQLSVERGEGTQRETGEITFANGHITAAQSGQLDGRMALDWLKTWGPCRFVFVNTQTDRITGPMTNIQMSPSTPSTLPTTRPSFPAISSTTDPKQRAITGPLQAMQQQPPTLYGPQRTCAADEGLKRLAQANASRLHRHLYLLIDGNRPFTELVRLMGRQPGEVQQILRDLERIGIIQIP
ncbi:hypothetical protein KDA_37170 [Dictyobacter alpinus]|uniref:PatA-like N-terminal domain-containing protein n=1 Tax=Dictyobacter alpinus TaxID=2014873 RepID=A0A402BA06_9CHLR|nr:DUF4388 domain-containing protein [Dictyobacter alpinus]GCE28233.1 hypothetical protein KDA_37170 [Dictyobacter alpinus]